MVNNNCPCKKKKCERYGNCDACRAYHAESKRKRPCERTKKKTLIVGIIAVLLLVLIGGYSFINNIFPKARPLNSPEIENILSVSLAANEEDTVTVNRADFEELLRNINNAQPTRKMSVNDYPTVKPYYIIDIQTSEREYCYFIYEDGTQVYIEIPYAGIYKSNSQMVDFILKHYTK